MSFGSFDKERFAVQAHDKFVSLVDAARAEVVSRQSPTGSPAAMQPLNAGLTVVARKRPLNDSECALGQYDVISCPDGTGVIVHEPRVKYDLSQAVVAHGFRFDRVYDERAGCMDLYAELLRPFVLNLDRGGQLTAFCYGQTGSGKSFTMGGLVDAALEDSFRLITASSTRARGLCVCLSYFEIYCNQVFDLLAARVPLALREDAAGNCQVVGLVEHGTRDIRVARELLARGTAARSIGTTKVNADSSRSHSVLQVLIREGGRGGALIGKASLVDLAGSEQASESAPPDKATHHEAAEINKSLLALKECIRAMGRGTGGRADSTASDGGSTRGSTDEESLGSIQYASEALVTSKAGRPPVLVRQGKGGSRSRPKHVHVPFRGSKLTQLLRDSFTSPGAATVMISTIGPGNVAAYHSLNTLRYAHRLKALGKGGRGGMPTVGGPPPAENSAGVRVGLLGPGRKEVVEGGFTHSNPRVHAPPPGMQGAGGEGEGVPLSRRLMPMVPSWSIGGVAPDEVWAANDAVIAAMRREMAAQQPDARADAHPAPPQPAPVVAIRAPVARPRTAAGLAPPMPPPSARVPAGGEARLSPPVPVPPVAAPAPRVARAVPPAVPATPPAPVSPPARTRREVGAAAERATGEAARPPGRRPTPMRGEAAVAGSGSSSSSELVALLDAQIGQLAALRARMASAQPSGGAEAEQAALIAALSRDALVKARPSRDGALLAALASASASADAINESVSLTLQTSMSGSEAPPAPAQRRLQPPPAPAVRPTVPKQRLGAAVRPPSAPTQRPSPYSQRVAVAVGSSRPSSAAAVDARAKGRTSLTPPSSARTPHGQGVPLSGPSMPSGSPKPARKTAPAGSGRGGWDAKLLGSLSTPPGPTSSSRGLTLAVSVSASSLAAAYRSADPGAGEEREGGPRRVQQGSGPGSFAVVRVK